MTDAPTRGRASGRATDQPHLLRLRIVNLDNNQIKVMLSLPINLVGVAQRLGAHLLPPNTSIETVVAQAGRDGVAELAWIDETHRERLELTVE
jgi:hypothetical protein